MTMAVNAKATKEILYSWEGKDKKGKSIKGEMKAAGDSFVNATLRRQGITVTKVKKQSALFTNKGSVSNKDITLFTRQLATMMKAGVPLLQSFDIVGKGHSNPAVAKLLGNIKADVETGSSLSAAFRKYPLYFDDNENILKINIKTIEKAHIYLVKLNKSNLDINTFISDLTTIVEN